MISYYLYGFYRVKNMLIVITDGDRTSKWVKNIKHQEIKDSYMFKEIFQTTKFSVCIYCKLFIYQKTPTGDVSCPNSYSLTCKKAKTKVLVRKQKLNLSYMKALNKIFLYTCYRDVAAANKNENKLLVPTYRNGLLKLLLVLWLCAKVINFCKMSLCLFLAYQPGKIGLSGKRTSNGLSHLNETYLPSAPIWSYLYYL